MPCPYFLPREPLKDTRWAIPPRAPLGVLCSGECHADAPTPAEHDLCNIGYARGVCDRFPADGPVDAVRFHARGEGLLYVLERDHVPVEHGMLSEADTRPLLNAQARMYRLHAPLLVL